MAVSGSEEAEEEERDEREPQGGGIGADLGTRVKFTWEITIEDDNEVELGCDNCLLVSAGS